MAWSRLACKRVLDEPQDGDVLQSGVAEDLLLRLDVGFAELAAFRRDLDVAFVQHREAEHHRSVHDGKQVVDVHGELVGQLVEIVAAAAVGQQFHESGDAAGTRVRQHLELGALARLAIAGLLRGLAGNRSRFVGTGQRLVDVIDVSQKARRLAIAVLRNVDLEIGANAPRIAAQHDDAVGQQHRLLDIVGHDEDGGGRHLLVEPQLQQLGAQVFRGEDIERRERLVHEEHFRLDHQRARKADALLHSAREFLGIRGFEAVETDGVDHLQGALVALDGAHGSRDQRRFDVFQNGEPGKQREALEDDGDIGNLAVHRLAVPQNLPGRRLRKAGQHAQQRGLSRAGRTEQADDLPRRDLEVGGRDHLDLVAVGLRVILLDRAGLNDRLGQSSSPVQLRALVYGLSAVTDNSQSHELCERSVNLALASGTFFTNDRLPRLLSRSISRIRQLALSALLIAAVIGFN